MTNEPNPGNEPNPELTPPEPRDRPPRRRRRWRRIVLPISIGLLGGLGAGAWWGWVFINERLAPLVATNLTTLFDRPVDFGAVERVTLTSIRFGTTRIPQTPTDPDYASVKAIEVNFNPIQAIVQVATTRRLTLDITLIDPQLFLDQSPDGVWLKTQIKQQEAGAITIEPLIRIQNANAVLLPTPQLPKESVPIPGRRIPVALAPVNGVVTMLDDNQRITYEADIQSRSGGNLKLQGETLVPAQRTNLQIQAQNFAIAEVGRLINLPVNLAAGRGGGNLSVQFRPNEDLPYIVGSLQFQGATMIIPQVPQPFTQATGQLQLKGKTLRLENVKAAYGKVPFVANGSLVLDQGYNITAQVPSVRLPTVIETLQVPLPFVVDGAVAADLRLTGAPERPVLSGTVRSTAPGRVDQVALDRFNGQFRLDTSALTLTVADIQATPTAGGQVRGSGVIRLGEPGAATPAQPTSPELAFTFQAVNVPGDPIARTYNNGNPLPITLGRVNAQAQIAGAANNLQTVVRWQLPEATYPGSGTIAIADGAIALQNTVLTVNGGTVTAAGRAANGRWQGNVQVTRVTLQPFSPDLQGELDGRFTLAGSLSSFSPADIRAQGQVRLSQGIAIIDRPLTAQVQWTGQQIVVQQATATDFSANGTIGVQLEGTPAITALNLNVRLDNYNLQDFPITVPETIQYAGVVDFAGRVTGTPAALNVNGDVVLRQFVVNNVAFEPRLQGTVRVGQGVNLDLRGQQDRIAATLDANYQPIAFDIRRDQAVATGRTQGGLLITELQNFPLTLVQFPGTTAWLSPTGTLTGTVAINLANQSASGQVAIDQLAFGPYRADQFGGRVSFANGVATLREAELRRGSTIFQIDLSANVLSPDPQVQGSVKVAQGNIQEVLELLQIFDLADFGQAFSPPSFGTAADLQTVPIEQANASLLNRLRRLAEIAALQAQEQAQEDESPLPPLEELTGRFQGEISFRGSARSGVNAEFSLQGEQWQWGRFSAERLVAVGSLENTTVTLLPLRIESGDAVIAYSGQIGLEQQSGQLRIENYPIEQLTALVDLPVDIEGRINATATLSGSLRNPQAVGFLSLVNGVLNGTPLQEARAGFNYANARLGFGSTFLLTGKEPLRVEGNLPYQFPFATVQPASNAISLDINVRDEGLALLNVLTNNQVVWQDGRGAVNLQVQGTLNQPIASGLITVQNTTLQVRALPEPLTNVNGTIRFVQDRLRVETLTGQFSRGQVSAQGVLPIFAALRSDDPDRARPLSVSLDQIALNLKGLYQGGVNGDIQVTGTAFNPVLGGDIQLANGQVLLSDPPEVTAQTVATTGQSPQPVVEFDNLRLTLGNAIRITRQPILNFLASGELTINGSLNELRPSGVINLRSGQVNIFTTQFNLARGYPQTATFQPELGLDPILDVRLIALVPEATGYRQPTSPISSEILDNPIATSNFGSLQTVRIQAQIQGPASELDENLELTSSPARTQSEIVALLGGGFVQTLGRGDSVLGIANLAGSALLTNVQNFIGNALGLSDFRLFTTLVPDDRRRNTRSRNTLGIAAEAGIDITPSISVSVLKILTSNQPAQFGLRYRINDNLLLRGSTDFSGDNRAVIEYEARF
ncbi:translocation/assembly module TamB domain-containing protein [Pantanalinema rosaneae CENA516]|uniref:translocation/assembly module TamB domain-containing protein n=1 Tax=Pantanalinema rosaneae TaxID=1620701 RepID=UPI003D6E71E0